MRNPSNSLLAMLLLLLTACNDSTPQTPANSETHPAPVVSVESSGNQFRDSYSPLHFKPAIETASDSQCLSCHKEILDDKVRQTSPAGVAAAESLAWYQQLATYQGDQETFHRRHLTTALAKQLMNLQCNSCHQGHDPREEAPGSSATGVAQTSSDFTLRKQVNPEAICLKCHGQMIEPEVMGLTGSWPEVKHLFLNDCLPCHASTRTERHNVSYLKAAAIEQAAIDGKTDHSGGDVCYGCHGGRAWYRIPYPYPRNAWPEMPEGTPDWAKSRSTQSESRFLKTEPQT